MQGSSGKIGTIVDVQPAENGFKQVEMAELNCFDKLLQPGYAGLPAV